MNLLATDKRTAVISALIHGHMVALYFMHFNFCRIYKTLRVTPANEAGLTDHVWSVEELIGLLERNY